MLDIALYASTLRRVIIETPYAGDIELNTAYARFCARDSLLRDEAPLLSHLLYTQPDILDDSDPLERANGIAAGLAYLSHVEAIIHYGNLGTSPGVKNALELARQLGVKEEHRLLTPFAMRNVYESIGRPYPDDEK